MGKRIFPILTFLLLVQIAASAANYYTTKAGNYSVCGNWNTCAPTAVPAGDTVFIDHTMAITKNLIVSGVVVVNSTGSIQGSKKIIVQPGGKVFNYGNININSTILIDGSFYNANYCHADEVHLNGYLCNSDTMSIDPGEIFKIMGGKVECGGTLLACTIKMREQGGVAAELREQAICCSDGTETEIDNIGGTVDSSSVFTCPVLLPSGFKSFKVTSDFFTAYIAIEINVEGAAEVIIKRKQSGPEWSVAHIFRKENISSSGFLSFQEPLPTGTAFYQAVVEYTSGLKVTSPVKILHAEPEKNEVKVYPNPASDVVIIETGSAEVSQLSIRNINGAVFPVQTSPRNNALAVDVSGLAPGLYYISFIRKAENNNCLIVIR